MPPGYQTECATNTTIDEWLYSRQWFCYIAEDDIVVNTIQANTGKVLGTVVFTATHAVGLDPSSATWSNFTALYLNSETGEPSNIVYTTNTCAGCSGSSVGYPFGAATTVALDTAVSGFDNLADNPASGAIDRNLSVSWDDEFTCAGCVTSAPINFASPVAIRCDAVGGFSASRGCTIPWFTPQGVFTGLNSGNTSTALVNFFQYYNNDHWGAYPSGATLTRLYPVPGSSRSKMCAGFVSEFTGDSCDEFPFASTAQDGPVLYGSAFKTSLCSNLKPVYDGGGKYTVYNQPGYSAAQRCAIGHVAGTFNSASGRQLGQFYAANRVISGDPFWIATAA